MEGRSTVNLVLPDESTPAALRTSPGFRPAPSSTLAQCLLSAAEESSQDDAGPKTVNLDNQRLKTFPTFPDGHDVAVLMLRHNRLTSVEQAAPLRMLTILDLEDNQLESLDGLRPLTMLVALVVAHNNIVSLEPLERMARLQVLKASHNCIQSAQVLSLLPQLARIDIAHNQLTSLDWTLSLPKLEILDAAQNKIASIPDLSTLGRLIKLCLQGNCFSSRDATTLWRCTSLNTLSIDSPHLSKGKLHRERFIVHLPRLVSLDAKRVTADHRRMAGIRIRQEEDQLRREAEERQRQQEHADAVAECERLWLIKSPEDWRAAPEELQHMPSAWVHQDGCLALYGQACKHLQAVLEELSPAMRDQTLAIEFHFWPIDQLTSSWRRPLARLALKSCTLCYNGILNFADVKCLSALNGVEQLALRNQPLLVKSKLWPQLCRAVVPSVKTINDSTTVESKVVDVLQDLLQAEPTAAEEPSGQASNTLAAFLRTCTKP
eukprot:TRINITY_DN9231_c0_g1_i2.p1 TRINITY_DN9231_c0_g1~~TRINITY_DN9231_c0_g1_i2.p1  ORF type:complete len:491 (+),score=117.27 TRINITY_DN9231_c0_g1_i2:163-1635(+)